MKQVLDKLGAILLVIVIIIVLVGVTMFQFSIYQKKHGKKMTFMEWMFDSERK